jgi:hypothetical protein
MKTLEAVARALFEKEHEKLEGWTWEKETADSSKLTYWMESAKVAVHAMGMKAKEYELLGVALFMNDVIKGES